jgi:hypothetical protein
MRQKFSQMETRIQYSKPAIQNPRDLFLNQKDLLLALC